MLIEEKKQLMIAACKVCMGVIEGTHGAKAGHPGGSLSAAAGMTLAAKHQGKTCRVYTLLGDGELEEGQAGWHGKAPNDEEYEIAMNKLRAQLTEVEAI